MLISLVSAFQNDMCMIRNIEKKKKFHLSNSSSNMNTFAQNCHTFLIKDFTR